ASNGRAHLCRKGKAVQCAYRFRGVVPRCAHGSAPSQNPNTGLPGSPHIEVSSVARPSGQLPRQSPCVLSLAIPLSVYSTLHNLDQFSQPGFIGMLFSQTLAEPLYDTRVPLRALQNV